MARRPISSAGAATALVASAAPPSDDADSSEEVTRCICGNEEFVSTPRTQAANANPGLFVQCEKCHVWQHGFCVGFLAEEDIPDEYYCEQCEPSFHNISMRHGILVSRYRPVKRSPASRSPRKSRSREAEPVGRSEASDSEEKADISNGSESDARNGDSNGTSIGNGSSNGNGIKSEPGSGASSPATYATNGESKRRKSSSEKPETADAKPGTSKGPDAMVRNTKDEHTRRLGQRSAEDGGARGGSATRRASRESPSPAPSPKQSRDNSEEPMQYTEDAKRFGKSDGSADQESRSKRNRRKNSDDGATSAAQLNPVRGRIKRRSREEEILQRVLEESAREARELEARRRSRDNGQPQDDKEAEKIEEPENPRMDTNGAEQAGTSNESSGDERRRNPIYSRSSKRHRTNGEAEVAEEDEDEVQEAADAAEEPSRRRKTRTPRPTRTRPGRRPASKTQNASQQRLADKQGAHSVSRRTPNGVKKCRPRIPSPRSTLQEMRRRVANILEFSGRTQVEMAEEKQSRSEGPFELASRDDDFRPRLEQLASMGDHNMTKLEELTRKLLSWEEQYGIK